VDLSRPFALRTLWLAGEGNTKVSHIHPSRLDNTAVGRSLEILGGRQKASSALEESQDWLSAWDDGEAQGKRIAESVMESFFEEAWVKSSAAALEVSPSDKLEILISDLVRRS
jgi:hypothetical protein